jgi:membrane protease YdiL (CAAX protease family)
MPPRSLLSRIFLSPAEPRLRAGWRIGIHFALMLGIVIVLSVLVVVVHLYDVPYGIELLVNELAIFVAINASVLLARRFLDRRSFVSLGLGLQKSVADLLVGIAIAGFVMAAIFEAEWLLGWLTVESFAWEIQPRPEAAVELAIWFLIFAVVGWQEELLSRGYWLQNLADGLNLQWALFISSALFALMHAGNPNASWVAIIGLFAAGYFLAYGYVLTRQLWLSIGLHIGWNFFEGNVFGFQVSGLDTFRLIHQTVHGPELWTGGAFGPEAGLIVLPAMVLGAVLIYGYVRHVRSHL